MAPFARIRPRIQRHRRLQHDDGHYVARALLGGQTKNEGLRHHAADRLVSSLFTSLFVTKTIFGILIDKFGVTKLSSLPLTFPAWNRFLHPNIDWLSKVKYFVAISAIFTIVGGWAFAHYFNKARCSTSNSPAEPACSSS
jgi:hypothetical protein